MAFILPSSSFYPKPFLTDYYLAHDLIGNKSLQKGQKRESCERHLANRWRRSLGGLGNYKCSINIDNNKDRLGSSLHGWYNIKKGRATAINFGGGVLWRLFWDYFYSLYPTTSYNVTVSVKEKKVAYVIGCLQKIEWWIWQPKVCIWRTECSLPPGTLHNVIRLGFELFDTYARLQTDSNRIRGAGFSISPFSIEAGEALSLFHSSIIFDTFEFRWLCGPCFANTLLLGLSLNKLPQGTTFRDDESRPYLIGRLKRKKPFNAKGHWGEEWQKKNG